MRNAKWLLVALGLVTLTAGCVQEGGYYPSTAYNNGAYRNTGYYQNTAYNSPSSNYWNSANRDADRDGIPNRYDRDANGDGLPDRYQGRR